MSKIVNEHATPEQHPDDAAVDRFAASMKAKLAKSRAKGRGGWEDKTQCSAEYLSELLCGHVEKGDPVDVANFCMLLQQRGESIAAAPAQGQQVEWRTTAVMLEQANAGLAQLNGKLRAELSALKAHPEAYQFDGQVLRDEHGNYLAEFMAYEQSFIDRLLHPQPELKAQQVGQEPAGEVHLRKGGGISLLHVELAQPLPPGTKLYTAPKPAPAQDVAEVLEPGKIVVSAEPLRRVLNALVNAPHRIRELQVTREPVELFADNPINILIAEFEAAHDKQSGEKKS